MNRSCLIIIQQCDYSYVKYDVISIWRKRNDLIAYRFCYWPAILYYFFFFIKKPNKGTVVERETTINIHTCDNHENKYNSHKEKECRHTYALIHRQKCSLETSKKEKKKKIYIDRSLKTKLYSDTYVCSCLILWFSCRCI